MMDLNNFEFCDHERFGFERSCRKCGNNCRYTILRLSLRDFFFYHKNGRDFFIFDNQKVDFDPEDIEKNQQLKKQRYLELEKEINDNNILLRNDSKCPFCSFSPTYYEEYRFSEYTIIWLEGGIYYQMKEKKAYKLIVKTEN